jgi:hypothetical protein
MQLRWGKVLGLSWGSLQPAVTGSTLKCIHRSHDIFWSTDHYTRFALNQATPPPDIARHTASPIRGGAKNGNSLTSEESFSVTRHSSIAD